MKVHRVRQHFARPIITDVETAIREQWSQYAKLIQPGASIAIAVGSRGIANLSRIVKAVVDQVQKAGAKPFIIPAMGSHGGATAEGQAALLESYGIKNATLGCAIRSSMEVVELERNALFMDRFAWESDGVILINRIKPHTDFHGEFESGLVKMAVIGLGKEKQAHHFHSFGVHGLRDLIPEAGKRILSMGKVVLGVGIVENAYDETAMIEVMPADKIFAREPELLAIAKKNMPRLPVNNLDVLIVDELGKNISGTGMDTNVIGRVRIAGEPEPDEPQIGSIVVRDLTPETQGNATGMGLADVVTRRFSQKIDYASTYTNIVTSGFLERGKLPVVAESDSHAFEIALRAAGCRDVAAARVVRIKNTLQLGSLFVSAAVRHEIKGRSDIEIVGEETDLLADL